ncbi:MULTISPECIES: non-ribosomal peptide synthetase [Serratia]|nr:non-ribosomal peptide synthetase [Serratia marcescens]
MLHKCFLSQIDKASSDFPCATAIIDNDKEYSFADIFKWSNNIASNLCSKGIGEGDFVAIYMNRSLEWMVSMLGILKSGAAYVPLDPEYPMSRIEYCLDNCGAKAVIVGKDQKCMLKDSLLIDSLLEDNNHSHTPRPRNENSPVYMIYTSGSTGNPKGVVVPFSALDHHMNWFVDAFDFSQSDIFLQKTSSSFDASVWEYLAPLMMGCKMVISKSSPEEIFLKCKKFSVTVLQLVPTVLDFLVKNYEISELKSLKMLFCGGEPLSTRLALAVHRKLSIPVINLYGPTETTVQCSSFCFMPNDAVKSKFVPIGKPISQVHFELSSNDDDDIGELTIEGPTVSDGYYRLESKTSQYFSTNFNTGFRRYKSGDLVRKDKDGNYHFVGRVDHQVKLRGLRIELNEIEDVINNFDARVKSSVVRINSSGQLVAHINTTENALDFTNLANHIRQQLPDYMVPNLFFIENEIPTLPNGKLDRNKFISKLNDSDHGDKTTIDNNHSIDKNDISDFIHAQWEKLLSTKPTETSHFFLSGGHSLSAINLVMQINKQFGTKLPTVCLLTSPRICDFIKKVESEVAEIINKKPEGI